MTCPHCGEPLMGLGTFCWACKRYTDEAPKGEAASTPAAVPDTRSEEDIRLATRRALEAHGWFVIDFEQGWRRDGSTRVVKGLPDLGIQGWGLWAWAEMKSATGTHKPDQKAFAAQCAKDGIQCHLWRHESEAIAWSNEQLKRMGRTPPPGR